MRIQITLLSKISAQPHTTLCIQFLDRENNAKKNTLALRKQICFTIAWGCAEVLPSDVSPNITFDEDSPSRGPGFWKFNNSLSLHTDYVEILTFKFSKFVT